jgi:hypothetical protein
MEETPLSERETTLVNLALTLSVLAPEIENCFNILSEMDDDTYDLHDVATALTIVETDATPTQNAHDAWQLSLQIATVIDAFNKLFDSMLVFGLDKHPLVEPILVQTKGFVQRIVENDVHVTPKRLMTVTEE